MKVETYEVEEVQGELGNMAADAEAQELIEKLGLEGQRKLFNPETCTRNPYRVMSKQEHLIYSALMRNKCSVEKYDIDTIPLRVLQVAAHAKDCGLFESLEVWYSDPAVLKDDPILVGYVRDGGERRIHLLARWGRALQALEQLEALAVTQARKKLLAQYEEVKRKCEQGIAAIRESSDMIVLSRTVSFYDYSE